MFGQNKKSWCRGIAKNWPQQLTPVWEVDQVQSWQTRLHHKARHHVCAALSSRRDGKYSGPFPNIAGSIFQCQTEACVWICSVSLHSLSLQLDGIWKNKTRGMRSIPAPKHQTPTWASSKNYEGPTTLDRLTHHSSNCAVDLDPLF